MDDIASRNSCANESDGEGEEEIISTFPPPWDGELIRPSIGGFCFACARGGSSGLD